MWDPDLVYLGGSVSTINNINIDRLSFFEIQDMCVGLGVTSKSRFHYLIPRGNMEKD